MPRPFDALGGQIDRDVGRGQDRAVPAPPARRSRALDPSQELIKRERLAEIIIRAAIEPRDPVGDGVAGGQEQDGVSRSS